MDEPTREEALASLDSAQSVSATLRTRGTWFRGYLLGFAAATVPFMVVLGTGHVIGLLLGLGGWGVVTLAMVLWSRTQPVVLREHKKRIGGAFAAWATVYGIALAVGLVNYQGNLAYWIVAALFTSLPLVIAALRPLDRPQARP